MKKFIPLLVFVLLVIPISVFAISGACSYHEGVNCSAGADWDGSVICNDGNRDSSVLYKDMTMCQSNISILIDLEFMACSGLNFDHSTYQNNQQQYLLKTCADKIEEDCQTYGTSYYCNSTLRLARLRTCSSLSIETSINNTIDKCNELKNPITCQEGYILRNGDCITYTKDCELSFGSNVYGVKGNNESMCYCNNGYSWNSTMTFCVANNTLYQRSSNTVIIPPVINSYVGMYGRTVYTDRPDPLKIVGAMIKGETDPATYIVDIDGKLRWIKTEDVAKRLFGVNWDSYITWFNDSIIYTYYFGDTINE